MDKMRNLLMIAYTFPPLGGSAAQRVVKFTRYLPQFGWRAVILTVKNSPDLVRDEDLINQIASDTPIYKAYTIEPRHFFNLYNRLPLKQKQKKKKEPATKTTEQTTDTVSKGSPLIRLQNWFFIPDARIGWLPFAVTRGKQILQTERIDAIFSSSSPYSSHLVARALSKWSGLPWIMDLRDPWLNNPYYSMPTKWHYNITASLEKKCTEQATLVTSVTPTATEELQQRYTDQPAEKFMTITNGFDSADIDLTLKPDQTCFSIRYIGTMYGGRSVLPFLRGLLVAIEHKPEMKKSLKVEFIGGMNPPNKQAWESFITAHGLQAVTNAREFMPHKEAVKLMRQSQVQLLIMGKGERMDRIYPGKLFEYLGTKRPILALSSPGVTTSLIEELEAGLVIYDEDDSQQVAEAILKFYALFQQGKLRECSTKGVDAFERRRLTKQFASVLNSLID